MPIGISLGQGGHLHPRTSMHVTFVQDAVVQRMLTPFSEEVARFLIPCLWNMQSNLHTYLNLNLDCT